MNNNLTIDILIKKIENKKKKLTKTPSLSCIKKYNFIRNVLVKNFPKMNPICPASICLKTYKNKNQVENIDLLSRLFQIKSLLEHKEFEFKGHWPDWYKPPVEQDTLLNGVPDAGAKFVSRTSEEYRKAFDNSKWN